MKYVFGIDLGTTYSCIAYIDEYGKPVVLKNSEGLNTTPSVVLIPRTASWSEQKQNVLQTWSRNGRSPLLKGKWEKRTTR